MKGIFRPLLAVLLVLALAAASAPGALASYALGTELHETVSPLGPGVSLTTQSLWSASKSDLRTERYLTYSPTGLVTPTVFYGEKVWSRGSLTKLAQQLEAGGHRVLGGTNGDYFVMSTGEPLGSLVTDGILRSGSPYFAAVGFRADGTAMVGMPHLSFWADFRGYHLILGGGYNKTQKDNQGGAVYNSDFGSGTRRTGQGTDVILRPVTVPEDYVVPVLEDTVDPETGEVIPPSQEAQDAALAASVEGFETQPAQLSIGGAVTCVVERVTTGEPVDIPAGRFVLSVAEENGEFLKNEVKSLRVGEQLTLSVTAGSESWNSAVTLIGAYQQIVRGGQEVAGLETAMAPRTALGLKNDGSVILYTIDGRQSGYSVGAGVDQVARRLIELGCVDGVLFDGGGSTTLGTTNLLDEKFAVQNRPSEGSLRAVTNALFFVSDLPETGEPGSYYITPQGGILLSGAEKSLSGWAIDTNYHPLYPMVEQVDFTVQGPGSMTGNVFTAGGEEGTAVVTATTPSGAQGQARFTVVTTPSAITVTDEETGQQVESLNLEPGESVSLTASSVWWKLPVESRDSCYTWTVSGGLGTVDTNGTLTAGLAAGAGSLSVAAGSRMVTVPLTVGGHVKTIHLLEGDLTAFQSGSAQVLPASGEGKVKLGSGALEVDFPLGGAASFTSRLPVEPGELYLGLWAKGTGAPLTLTAQLTLADGSSAETTFFSESFAGWKRFFAPIPADTAAIDGFTVLSQEDPEGTALTGRLYLDHLVSANAAIADDQPPVVEVALSPSQLTAELSDNVDKTFAKDNIQVTLDGKPLDFTLNGGRVTATLPAGDTGLHRVSVTVSDASGNLGRGTGELAPAPEHPNPFADTQTHWAKNYITYLQNQGVANGVLRDGVYYYDPDRNITRGEFAALLARWSRVDVSAYREVELPFVDKGAIPAWALDEVKALYALGVFTGSQGQDGLYANAGASITRAQAMTMLGRIQPRGYDLSPQQFSDHDLIPAWASEHIYSLAAQGVVSGFQGRVRPTDPVTRAEVAKMLASMW